MSFLDCSCISPTQVQPMDIEECYEDTSLQHLQVSLCDHEGQTMGGGDSSAALSAVPAHYQFLTELGRGFNNLSQVHMARHTPTGQLVAVKQTNLDEVTEEELLQLMNEVLLSRRFRHPNLLTSRLVFSSCCQLWVLTPLMAYGSAHSLLRTHFPDGMSESLIAYLLYGVLQALEYLHRMGYVHRGVKASHILLSEEGRVYLSGLHGVYSMMRDGKRMRVVFDMPHHSPALLPWLSPELLQQDLRGYGVKSDIYSLGIAACELVSGRVPFQDMVPTQTLLLKLRGLHPCLPDTAPFPLSKLKVSRSGLDSGMGESSATGSATHSTSAPPLATDVLQSPAPKNHSATLHSLVQLCLQQQPDRRPSASALLTHAFFKQVKKHTRDSFLSLMYPAVPLTSSEGLPLSCPPSPPCHVQTASPGVCAEVAWDFS
ncbi:STE20-related kinase adapter protein beta isoform X1 [Nerophis lumbriciformis]|uniref:STE20-related kinase adapter protein beta isoform X1 n=1 Tax=Nerophis lumbriciformis TaxID=546530 RepID=UPI002ADF2879|nr:STE20-related kinase adapter protein beta-like isoform X1 [Nerophis lumbriciformis]XP_061834126.1 STE20-related kinase adapter protein beta-like isoform X1 [Nerophis lumbriciformis]